MKANKAVLDLMFAKAKLYFPAFRLPFRWKKLNNSNLAEWQNDFASCGEFHKISINFKLHRDNIDLFNTICHELVHAWQYENGIETDHEIEFCEWVVKFAKIGVNIASPDCNKNTIKKAYKRFT